ncbi:MAG: hypothetical protein IPO27_00165 [Bacteroidetes bacterium]|nr:hypothetical protein [Bacteroidota bacterium]
MNKNFLYLAIVVAFFAVITGCTDTGNEPEPDVDERDVYLGAWTCAEKSKLYGNSTYNVSISKIGNLDSIAVSNFYNLTNSYKVTMLISSNSVTIPLQSVSNTNISGFGLLSNNKINLTYYCVDGNDKDTVTATYSK